MTRIRPLYRGAVHEASHGCYALVTNELMREALRGRSLVEIGKVSVFRTGELIGAIQLDWLPIDDDKMRHRDLDAAGGVVHMKAIADLVGLAAEVRILELRGRQDKARALERRILRRCMRAGAQPDHDCVKVHELYTRYGYPKDRAPVRRRGRLARVCAVRSQVVGCN
jgi:hypothetical protein